MKEASTLPLSRPPLVRLRVKTAVIYSGALIIGRIFASDILGVCFVCLFVYLFVCEGEGLFWEGTIFRISRYICTACALSLARTVSKLF